MKRSKSETFFPVAHGFLALLISPIYFKSSLQKIFEILLLFTVYLRRETLLNMGCLGNSKTEDQRIDEKAQREANKKIEKQLQKERQAYKATHRLLLLGKT